MSAGFISYPIAIPVVSVGGQAELTFVGTDSDAVDLATYTFVAQPLGSAVDRISVITVNAVGELGRTISSATVNGNSATLRCQVDTLSNATTYSAIITCPLTASETVGNVIITFNTVTNRCAIGVYELIGASSAVPFATAVNVTPSDPQSVTLNFPANGCGVGCGAASNAADATWTGLNKDVDAE